MSELIRREDVMALWEEYHPYIAVKAIEFGNALKEIPSAEPKRGKWIDSERAKWNGSKYYFIQCSHCGHERDDCDHRKDTPFCPECGANMEVDHD